MSRPYVTYVTRPTGESCTHSGCGEPRRAEGQRYCRAHHAEAQRVSRRRRIEREVAALLAVSQRTTGVSHDRGEAA